MGKISYLKPATSLAFSPKYPAPGNINCMKISEKGVQEKRADPKVAIYFLVSPIAVCS